MKTALLLVFIALTMGGCASYQHAQNVKMISFSDDLSKGQSAGQIEGEDCTWQIFGYQLGDEPTISKAFMNTQNQADMLGSAGLKVGKSNQQKAIRYMNNVSTENGGFDAKIIGKKCLIVKGAGYK